MIKYMIIAYCDIPEKNSAFFCVENMNEVNQIACQIILTFKEKTASFLSDSWQPWHTLFLPNITSCQLKVI